MPCWKAARPRARSCWKGFEAPVGWVSDARHSRISLRHFGASRNPPADSSHDAHGGLRRIAFRTILNISNRRLTHPTKSRQTRRRRVGGAPRGTISKIPPNQDASRNPPSGIDRRERRLPKLRAMILGWQRGGVPHIVRLLGGHRFADFGQDQHLSAARRTQVTQVQRHAQILAHMVGAGQ